MLLDNTSSLISAFSLLLTGGAVTWFFRSGTNVEIAKKDSTEALKKTEELEKRTEETAARHAVLESRVNQQDMVINEIREELGKFDQKLDRLPEIVTAMEFIKSAIINMVSRPEQDAKLQNLAQRLDNLEDTVREIKERT